MKNENVEVIKDDKIDHIRKEKTEIPVIIGINPEIRDTTQKSISSEINITKGDNETVKISEDSFWANMYTKWTLSRRNQKIRILEVILTQIEVKK